jgi:hypothetical protein
MVGFIDCDFNQMLDLKVSSKSKHISSFNAGVKDRNINFTTLLWLYAGAGSSCQGVVAN